MYLILYSEGVYTKCAIQSSLNLKNKNRNKDKNDRFAKISPACRHVEFLSKISIHTRKKKKKNTKNINWHMSTKGTLVIIAKGTQQVDPLKPKTELATQIVIFEEVMKCLIA